MEAGDLNVGQTNVNSAILRSTDAPAVHHGPAGGGTHPYSLGMRKNKKFSVNTTKVSSAELCHINLVKRGVVKAGGQHEPMQVVFSFIKQPEAVYQTMCRRRLCSMSELNELHSSIAITIAVFYIYATFSSADHFTYKAHNRNNGATYILH